MSNSSVDVGITPNGQNVIITIKLGELGGGFRKYACGRDRQFRQWPTQRRRLVVSKQWN